MNNKKDQPTKGFTISIDKETYDRAVECVTVKQLTELYGWCKHYIQFYDKCILQNSKINDIEAHEIHVNLFKVLLLGANRFADMFNELSEYVAEITEI